MFSSVCFSCKFLWWPSCQHSSFQLKCFLGPAHTSESVLTTTPARVARLWACDPEPFHLPVKLPFSDWACNENGANFTRLTGSVCSMALDCTVFSKLFQTPEIYINYLTCEDKIAHERKEVSLSEWALESSIHFLRASLYFDFWLQTQPKNDVKCKNVSMLKAQ